MQKRENLLWSTKKDDSQIMTREKMIITDENRFNELFEELRDISKYRVDHTNTFCSDFYNDDDKKITYFYGGASRVERLNINDHSRVEYFLRTFYTNPRKESVALLSNEFGISMDLLSLFGCIDLKRDNINCDSKDRLILEKIIESNVFLDNECFKNIVNRLWPDFGFFATKGLDCIEFEPVFQYSFSELDTLYESMNDMAITPSGQLELILRNRDLAKSNGKVLSLARRLHALTTSSKK